MEVIIIDIQGFTISGKFIPKVLAIKTANNECQSWTFKPPQPYHSLTFENRRTVRYVEDHILGLRYSSGDVDLAELDEILKFNLAETTNCKIYVRGYQKYDFLYHKLFNEFGYSTEKFHLMNLERTNDAPNLKQSHECCSNYCKRCATCNVKYIYNWLKNEKLP